MVSTAEDGSVIVWNARTRTPVERLYGHAGRVLGAAFTADGRTLFTSSLDGAVFKWDLGTSKRFGLPFSFPHIANPATVSPATPPAPLLAVSGNGRLFAASASQSSVQIFSTTSLRQLSSIRLPANRNVGAGAWAGSRFVLGADRGLVQFWNLTGGKPSPGSVLQGLSNKGLVRGLAASQGGRIISAVDGWLGKPTKNAPPPEEGELAIWRSGKLVGGKPLELHNTWGNGVAISPDGRLAAMATDDSRVLIVDTSAGSILRTIRPQTGAQTVAFSSDGTLATGSNAGIVDLWNPNTGRSIGHSTLTEAAPVAGITFAPDGKTFATTGGSSGGARIWVTATQQQLGSDFPGGAGQWGNIAYTPNGRYLLVVYGDGTGYRWPVSLTAWEQHACTVAGRNFTHEEWQRFVGGRGYARICPQYPAGR
jgi:sugar lactone lactonase YvrE